MKVDLKKYRLETERLKLRSFEESDLNDFYEYAHHEGVGEWAGWCHHRSIDESQKILKMFIENSCDFAIVYKENNKVIGSLGVMDHILPEFKDQSQVEIGYTLSKDYWGKGLMTEACKEVIKFCFNELNCDLVWICHGDFNERSRRVIAKLGFTYFKDDVNDNSFFPDSKIKKIYFLKRL